MVVVGCWLSLVVDGCCWLLLVVVAYCCFLLTVVGLLLPLGWSMFAHAEAWPDYEQQPVECNAAGAKLGQRIVITGRSKGSVTCWDMLGHTGKCWEMLRSRF